MFKNGLWAMASWSTVKQNIGWLTDLISRFDFDTGVNLELNPTLSVRNYSIKSTRKIKSTFDQILVPWSE